MPIYEYRCASCGHQQEFLQKVSAPPLTVCTECGKETFGKMVTAAGFQLKGSGWYATDFRNKGSAPAKPEAKEGKGAKDAKDGKSEKSGEGPKDAAPASGAGGCASCS